MNKTTFSFIVLLISISIFGQKIPFEVKKSELFRDEYKDTRIVVSEDDGKGGVLIVRSYKGHGISRNEGFYFEHYDKDLKLVKDYDLNVEFPVYQKQKTFLGCFFKDNHINIVDVLFDLKQKAYICTATIIDASDFKTKQKELFRFTREEIKQYGNFTLVNTYENSTDPFFKYLNSNTEKDSEIMMAVNNDKNSFSITLNAHSDDTSIFKLYLFGSNMNAKFETVYERNIKDKNYKFQSIEVSNDGNSVCLLGKVFTDDKKKNSDGAKYQFELTKIGKDSQKTQHIDIADHFSKSLKTIFLRDKLVLVGLYSDQKDNRFKGISYFELDPESLIINSVKFHPFTEQFLKDKYGDDKPKELKYVTFKNILISDNEEIIFNAEEFYMVVQGNGGGMAGGIGGGGQAYYHFDDIISIKLDNKGDISWSRNINKRQSQGVDSISFISNTSVVNNNNDLCFFINTDENVKKLNDGRIEFSDTRKGKYDLNIIRIDKDGKLDYDKVLDNEENEVPFMVSDGLISKNSVFFLGQKGTSKQLLKVTL